MFSNIRVAGELRKKTFAALAIFIFIVSIWSALFIHSTFGRPPPRREYSWIDTFKIYKDATSVYADIRTFTNNETFPVNIKVEARKNKKIDILQYYKLSANETDFVIISNGALVLRRNIYYGLEPRQKLCFTVEAEPTDLAIVGDTLTLEVLIKEYT